MTPNTTSTHQNNKYKNPPLVPKYIGLLILVFFVFILGWNVGMSHQNIREEKVKETTNGPTSPALKQVDMTLFWDTWEIINSRYVDTEALDTQAMLDGAIHGLVGALKDPYSAYMNPKENQEFQDFIEGTLEGIGAELTLRDNKLTLVSPLKNSPAARAGLQPEDVIYKIDGELTENIALEQAVMKIRGPKGTAVVLSIIRDKIEEPFDVKITRQTININSIDSKIIDNIAIIEINQFSRKTQEEFSKTVSGVMSKSPKGIILDLRFNGGGYLDGAVDITSEFIEKGKVVSIKKRNPNEDEVIYVNGKARIATLPMVVLINRGSASAAEIVAGALQDYGRATIIGESSFGKGTVQEVENLRGGSSLRYTIAKWYTPNDRNISAVGIQPDIVIERKPEDFQNKKDPQLDAAIEELKKKF